MLVCTWPWQQSITWQELYEKWYKRDAKQEAQFYPITSVIKGLEPENLKNRRNAARFLRRINSSQVLSWTHAQEKEIKDHGINIGKTRVSCTRLICLCQQMITHKCFGALSDVERAECRHMNAYLTHLRRISKGILSASDSMTDILITKHELCKANFNEYVQEEREYTIRQMRHYWSKDEIDKERNQKPPYDTKPSLTAVEEKEHIYQNFYTEKLFEDMNAENEEEYVYECARVRTLPRFKPLSDTMKEKLVGYKGAAHSFFKLYSSKLINISNEDILPICQAFALERCTTMPSSRLEQARCKSINADITWLHCLSRADDYDTDFKQAEARSELMLLLWHKDDPVKKAALEATLNKITEATLQELIEKDRQCLEQEQVKKQKGL